MITVSKEFQWAMAHMLDGHEGLCKNLHGHEYKLVVTVARKDGGVLMDESPANGMVIDFKELKKFVGDRIVNPLDHALLLNGNTQDAFEMDLISLVDKYDKKHIVVPYRPTAENMVADFAKELKQWLDGSTMQLVKLRLFETPTSYADWTEGSAE